MLNFGRNILNVHDNLINSADMIVILIEVHVSTDDPEPTNQVTQNTIANEACKG